MLGAETGTQSEIYESLGLVKSLFLNESEYILLLCSPSISLDEKLKALDMAFDGRINESVASFLKLLTSNSRAELFYDCFDDYERLYNESKRLMLVKVTSATELTDDEKERIKKTLEKKYGLDIELSCFVDKEILGGIIIEADDTVIDGSLRKKLRDVKDVIKA